MASSRAEKSLANHEIVTLAVYLLGGELQFIDTEDVAVKANELAPGRFTWRKYPQQINIENVRTFLSDAKKLKNGSFLIGSGKEGWMLTEEGRTFVRARVDTIGGDDLGRKRLTTKDRQWLRSERARMLASDAYLRFAAGGSDDVTSLQAAAFFRLDDYVTGQARERKILRLLNNFTDDPELGRAVTELAAKVRKG